MAARKNGGHEPFDDLLLPDDALRDLVREFLARLRELVEQLEIVGVVRALSGVRCSSNSHALSSSVCIFVCLGYSATAEDNKRAPPQ